VGVRLIYVKTPAQYLGIANSLAIVSTFAGGFTYSNVITMRTNPSTCCANEFNNISTILSITFLLFSVSLFSTIIIQLILRVHEPDKRLPAIENANGGILPRWKQPHFWVQTFMYTSSTLLIAGFILLDVVLLDNGQTVVGAVGIAVVGSIAISAALIGIFT
jgi:hypothetical protein